MAQILDQYGRPLKRQEVLTPIAEPTIGGVRPVISSHPAEGLSPRRLAGLHLAAAQGDPLSYLELAEDIEERDLHYAAVLATRKRSVSQLPITVAAASEDADHKKHAEYVQSWLDDGLLQSSLVDMLDAIGKGFSVLEIDWHYHLGHLCPRDLIYRPQRWFRFARADGETVVLDGDATEEPLPAHKFVVHRHKQKSGLTIRGGIARIASWSWMYKSFNVKDWATFVQNYGMPLRVGKYGPGATEAQKDVLWRAVANIAGDVAAVIPDGMVIEFHEAAAKGTSTDLYERRADWLDRQVSKLVLGQTTTTDAVSGGHAVAQEHRLVQEDIERADALAISHTISRQVIANLVAFEFGPQDRYPFVRVGRPDEVPLEQFAAAFDKLGRQGLTAPMSWIRGRLGIPAPEEGEELVGGKAPAPVVPPAEDLDQPPEKSARNAVARLFASRHTASSSEAVLDRLVERLDEDARGALGGLTAEIRAVLEGAADLRDAAEQLARMNLSPDQLADAMARGMALAHLAGQAALIDDMARRR